MLEFYQFETFDKGMFEVVVMEKCKCTELNISVILYRFQKSSHIIYGRAGLKR